MHRSDPLSQTSTFEPISATTSRIHPNCSARRRLNGSVHASRRLKGSLTGACRARDFARGRDLPPCRAPRSLRRVDRVSARKNRDRKRHPNRRRSKPQTFQFLTPAFRSKRHTSPLVRLPKNRHNNTAASSSVTIFSLSAKFPTNHQPKLQNKQTLPVALPREALPLSNAI